MYFIDIINIMAELDQGKGKQEIVVDAEIEAILVEAREILGKLKDPEFLKQVAVERLEEEVCPLIEYSLDPGDGYGFEVIFLIEEPKLAPLEVDRVSLWNNMDPATKKEVVEEIGDFFEVELGNPDSESYKSAVVRTYEEEGVKEAASEGKVQVAVLKTNNPAIEIHVSEYKNKSLGTQYSLVRAQD